MSTTQQMKGEYENGGEHLETSNPVGTSARTRAFSYEQIMLRRRKKKLSENAKEETVAPKSMPERGDSLSLLKDSKDATGGNVTTEILVSNKTSPRHESHYDSKFDSKDKIKVKSNRDKEVNGENQSRHQNRRVGRSKAESERETEKKLLKDTQLKGNKQEIKFGEHLRTDERINLPDTRERARRSSEVISAKRYDLGHRVVKEPLDRRKHGRYEEQSSKRRRSRSREYDRVRARSPSPLPKGHKRSFPERDHVNPSNHIIKHTSGRQNSNPRNYRTSGSSRHESAHDRRQESSLGGYSPRKRKPEATSSKISSPPLPNLPEKKEAKWDLPPSGVNHTSSLSFSGNLQPSIQKASDRPSTTPHTSMAAPTVLSTSIDSVHLTQATRSLRSLYMENLPPSATDKSVLSSLNDFLLAAGANHVPGSQPCIACIINKEKGQAVVEFLTPEDATAALSFDGKSMSGIVLKFRRPKDFVDALTTGVHEKPVPVLNQIDDTVYDSPHKIFIGGVSELLSSDKLLAIVSAFGPVKAYHFEFNPKLNQSCAFLEYVEHSITQKACAGLNGLKLGGQVITAVRTMLHADMAEGSPQTSLYRIPKHAEPLLESPTRVLKLRNLLDQESFSQLSEVDLEEMLEDVRLECARFGTIKSANIVKFKVSDPVSLKSEENGQNQTGKPDPVNDSQAVEDLPELVNPEGGEGLARSANEDLPIVEPLTEEDEELEPGCVLVEFLRKEAACAAAHILNGRLYDGRVVAAAYVDHEVYMACFPR